MGHAQRRQYFGRVGHGFPIGSAAHYDADQRLSLRHVAPWSCACARSEKRWLLTLQIGTGNGYRRHAGRGLRKNFLVGSGR
jgi:hypothetical protein